MPWLTVRRITNLIWELKGYINLKMLNLHKIWSQNYNERFVGSLNSWPSSSSKERLSKAKNNLKAANSQDINTTEVSHF